MKYDVTANCHLTSVSIHIIYVCYFNGFVYRLSFCSQGQHFDIFMDNVDMVYMNIMICWNIIMVMCIYFGPAIMVERMFPIAVWWKLSSTTTTNQMVVATQFSHDLLEYYNGYVYIFWACHWRLSAAHYLQAVVVQFVQFAITKQSIKAYCLLFVYFYTAPNSLGSTLPVNINYHLYH
jgi:hypothetical protein